MTDSSTTLPHVDEGRGRDLVLAAFSVACALRTDDVLVKLGEARTALSAARTLQETKKIADVAYAARMYAKRRQLGEEAVRFANGVIFEAERRIGEILRATPKAKGAAGPGRGKAGSKAGRAFNSAPTLANLGIDRKTSSRAQQLAALPDEIFVQVQDGKLPLRTALRQNRPDDRGHIKRHRGRLLIREFEASPRLLKLLDDVDLEVQILLIRIS